MLMISQGFEDRRTRFKIRQKTRVKVEEARMLNTPTILLQPKAEMMKQYLQEFAVCHFRF